MVRHEGSEQAIVSASPDFLGEALRELRGVKPRELLGPGVELVDVAGGFSAWAAKLVERPPIFVRHVSPVYATASLADGLDELRDRVGGLLDRFEPDATFAAQVQLLDSTNAGRHQVRAAAHDVITQALGIEVSIPSPAQVLSIVVASERTYLGVSPVHLNLSSWPGGMRRYAREPGQVSRSEFKLLEALEIFDIVLVPGSDSLDLGASPGGWTRVLAERDVRVAAIDPAELHPSMEAHRNVVHYRTHVQDLVKLRDLPAFSFVGNDMRMDARDSARLLVGIKHMLSPHGHGVMTLKLPTAKAVGALRRSLEILREGYHIAGVRQLFHNRNEVTVHVTW